MYYGPYTVSTFAGDKVCRFIFEAAQAWADEEYAIVLDSNKEAIPNDVLEAVLS